MKPFPAIRDVGAWLRGMCVYNMARINPRFEEIHALLGKYSCLDGVSFDMKWHDGKVNVPELCPSVIDLIRIRGDQIEKYIVGGYSFHFVDKHSYVWVPIASMFLTNVCIRLRPGTICRVFVFQIPKRGELKFAQKVQTDEVCFASGKVVAIIKKPHEKVKKHSSSNAFWESCENEKIFFSDDE